MVVFVLFWVGVFSLSALYTYLEERKVEKFIEDMQRPYLEDIYGGETPEETFNMFLEALKSGDIELASKYFTIDSRKKQREYLEKVVKVGRLNNLVNDLDNGINYRGSLYDDNQQFEIKDENGKVIFSLVDFIRYPSGVWKISEL